MAKRKRRAERPSGATPEVEKRVLRRMPLRVNANCHCGFPAPRRVRPNSPVRMTNRRTARSLVCDMVLRATSICGFRRPSCLRRGAVKRLTILAKRANAPRNIADPVIRPTANFRPTSNIAFTPPSSRIGSVRTVPARPREEHSTDSFVFKPPNGLLRTNRIAA